MRARILVTGSRNWPCPSSTVRLLRELAVLPDPGPEGPVLIHGNCPTGVDRMADFAARSWGWEVRVFPPDWSRWGRQAGPRRNQRMIEEGKPTVAVAMPSPESVGTWDCVRRLRLANVRLVLLENCAFVDRRRFAPGWRS